MSSLSSSKEIIPAAVKSSLNYFIRIQKEPNDNKVFSSLSGISSYAIPLDCAKSISLDVVDGFKTDVQKRKHSSTQDAIDKMANDERLFKPKAPIKSGKNEPPELQKIVSQQTTNKQLKKANQKKKQTSLIQIMGVLMRNQLMNQFINQFSNLSL